MSQLISSFVAYRAKRAEIRARQRAELEKELRPFLKAFGKAVVEEQSKGKRIEDIEYAIGAKNRTLVYAAKRAAKDIYTPVEAETPEEPIEPPKPQWRVNKARMGNEYKVFFDNGDTYVGTVYVENDADITVPDEWALDSDNAGVYREIIKHIKAQL